MFNLFEDNLSKFHEIFISQKEQEMKITKYEETFQ